ncbi:MAG: DNA repair protein RadC [Clostridia bacterium]|nr:DNA repair protein RadC [Clostridia bacterium]
MEEKKAIHMGHRERVRQRFRSEGLLAFSEHEVLELLLTYAIPQRDVNPLAHELVRQFGSLSGVLEADESELMRVPGVGQNAALLLTMMPQLMSVYQRSAMGARPMITNLDSARRYCGALFVGAHDERVYAICLDKSGRVIHPALLHKGTLDEVTIYPRVVLETALRYHAHSVLLAHNHPGGVCEPSQADYDSTVDVVAALKLIRVTVIDHLIISGDSVYSMTKQGRPGGKAPGPEEFSYLRGRSTPDGRTTLKEGREAEWIALDVSGMTKEPRT